MANILVVDDNSGLRRTVEIFLQKRGFKVQTACNGQEAVDAVRILKPDIILMDMNMPIMDGWSATRELKNDIKTCELPIVALTAYALPGDQARCIAAGCDGCLSKPIDFDILATLIDELLTKRRFAECKRPTEV